MPALVHTGWSYKGIDAVTLENPRLRLDILTGLGAKIYNLIDLECGRNLLWHNHRVVPAPAPFGSNFDDHWAGGWDEPFPNGAQASFDGTVRPYLGELWARPWQWEVLGDADDVSVHLWCDAVITPARVEKWITLDPTKPIVRFHHRITNTGLEAFDFMFGIHPALAVRPGDRIDLPAAIVDVGESRDNRLGVVGRQYPWPMVSDASGREVDLRSIMDSSAATYGLLYAHRLSKGWLAVSAHDGGPSLALAFPTDIFRSVWLWLVYGGWRGFHHVAVEPWTGHPASIDAAYRLGETSRLAARESLQFDVTATIYRGLRQVRDVTMEGEVVGIA